MGQFRHDITWDDMSQFGLWCEGCGQDLLAGRDDLAEHGWFGGQPSPGWVLEHLVAIAELHDKNCEAQRTGIATSQPA